MIYQVVLGVVSIQGIAEGGVAYFAHIGGFAAGLILIGLWKKSGKQGI